MRTGTVRIVALSPCGDGRSNPQIVTRVSSDVPVPGHIADNVELGVVAIAYQTNFTSGSLCVS
jgi:hypothetical protein